MIRELFNWPYEEIQQHASAGGFPANSIAEIKSVIDPTTAERGRFTVVCLPPGRAGRNKAPEDPARIRGESGSGGRI